MFLCCFYCLISFLQLAAFCQQFIKEMCYVMLCYIMTSDPDFKVKIFLKSNIGKTARLKDRVTVAQEETIPSIRCNGTAFGDLD